MWIKRRRPVSNCADKREQTSIYGKRQRDYDERKPRNLPKALILSWTLVGCSF